MGLGERSARHDTRAARRHQAVRSELFAEFRTGQRVRTVDGVPGIIAAIEDGPYPGTEAYRVELDHGMGGGLYRSGDLSAATATTAAEASTEHTAETDYPELGSILRDRPDPARDLGEHLATLAARHRASPTEPDGDEPGDGDGDDGDDDGGDGGGGEDHPAACSYCGGTHFDITEHTGRSLVAQCQTCGGTMSTNGGQWTPELIGDPGNHPSQDVDPASGANNAPTTVRRDTVTNERLSALDGGAATDQHDTATHGDQARSAAMDGPDWCTHRRAARCYYPGDIAHDGTLLGIPQDRGPCPWSLRYQQQLCPISEAGPEALMRNKGFTATQQQEPNEDARRIVAAATTDPEFRFEVTAAWADVRNKATRLRREGGVRITSATADTISGEVKGDHHIYETQINYVPGSSKLAHWQCGCRWAAFTWGRSPKYRRFEGRSCSHSLALQFEAQQRGMFGKEIGEDQRRPHWMKPHTPVVIKNDRDGDIDSNWTRRSVPPGNMRRTWGSHQASLDVEGVYPDDHGLDLSRPPLFALASELAEQGHDADKITAVLITAGLDADTSQRLTIQAQADTVPRQQRAAALWRRHPRASDAEVADHLACSLDVADEPPPTPAARHAAAGPASGQPWEELLAQAAAQHEADAAAHDYLREVDEGWPTKPPPHSDTDNPASTGFAASEDPPDWGQLPTLLDSQQPSWEASLHHGGADEDPETQLDYDGLAAHEVDKGGITPYPNMDTYRNRAQRGDVSWSHPMDPHRRGPIWNQPGQHPEDFGHLLPHSLSVLHEHPEPALPSAEGDTDDEQHDDHGSDADLYFSLDQTEQLARQRDTSDEIPTADHQMVPNSYRASRDSPAVDDMVARFQASSAGAALGGTSSQNGHSESDIATAARARLAKTSLKNFSPAEQAELLGERPADGDGARNRDRLQLQGTHYEALEGAHSTEELLRHLDDLFL